jgi:membrane-bound lytic murein transglycosylase D
MGTDKIFGYPLAIVASLAMMTQRPERSPYDLEVDGGGGASQTAKEKRANVAERTTSVLTNPAPALRPGAETPELRTLRAAETRLFPEYAHPPLDQKSAAVGPASCDNPDYDLARSVAAEIPAAPDWLKGLERPSIAVPRDPKVAKYIRHFGAATEGRSVFSNWLRRSGAYRRIVSDALEKRGLPQDLMAVMFVESGCWPKAVSPAGAAGLWQFMPQTARAYGLTIQPGYDERRNIWRSTDAAINHLADLYNQFQSWHLALAAYNLGYQRLIDRLEQTKTEDFFSLARHPEAIPVETALYVPKVLAIAVILRNLEYFGFDDVEQLPAISASRITVPPNTRLSILARAAGTSLRRIRELNPQFLGDEIPDAGSTMYAHLPNSGLARAKMMLPRLLNSDANGDVDLKVTSDFDWGRDEIDSDWRGRLSQTNPTKRGDGATSSTEASSANGALEIPRRRSKHHTGLEAESGDGIPMSLRRDDASPKRKRSTIDEELAYESELAPSPSPPPKYYLVRRGDTLSELARSFNVTQEDLMKANRLKNPSRIMAGSRLRIIASND